MNQIDPINVSGFEFRQDLAANSYLEENIVDECLNVLSHAIDTLANIQCSNIH